MHFLEVDSVVSSPSLAPVCILLFKNMLFDGHVDTGKEGEGETNWENRTDIYTHVSKINTHENRTDINNINT